MKGFKDNVELQVAATYASGGNTEIESVADSRGVTVNVQGSLIQRTGPSTASSYASGYFSCYGAETLTWVVATYSTTSSLTQPC